MSTDTTGLVDVTFAVNAWGAPAGGKWPHFTLLLDGVIVGDATVASATLQKYTFTAKVPADQAHKLQLQYDNDSTVSGEDRNLFVKSFEVNGTKILSIDPSVTYDTGAIDGKNVIAGQTEMYWPGALNVSMPPTLFPSSTGGTTTPPPTKTMTSQIVVTAWGQSANGGAPHFKLVVDDKVVGDAWVSATSATNYAFSVDVDPDEAHKIQVIYDNDATINGQDRNLFVQGIKIDGQTIKATDQYATYDKGPVDGKFVVAGQEGLFWGGALTFGVPESYFGGVAAPPPPPPAPPAPLSTVDIVVNAWGQSAGGVPPHFKLLVDGVVVGDGRATSSQVTAFAFKTDLDATKAHNIQVVYDNDSTINGQDRNLYVKSVAVNGRTVNVTDSNVTYDKGAVDGKDVVKGQEGLYWGGALNVNASAALFQPPPPAAPTGAAFYVATNGKDTWSGKLSAPNADGTDGPFATLARAQTAMRSGDITTTYVRGGTYQMTSTLQLTSQDSGHSFLAYPGETPVLDGGQKISSFVSEGNGVFSAKLSSATDLDLTIGGVRQQLASKGLIDSANPTTTGWYFADAAASGASTTQIRYHAGDISAADIKAGTRIMVMDSERLSDTISEIASIDETTHTITLKTAGALPFTEGTTFKLLNNAAFVDQAGEFAWRASDGSVVFKPADPNSFAQSGVEVARLGTLINLNGATGVTIQGLGFTNTTTGGFALQLSNSSGNNIGNNSFTNVGTAIKLTSGSSNNRIGGNTFDHLAVDGIDLNGRSNGNYLYDNRISHIGEVRKGVAGIMGTAVDNNTFAYNTIDSSARYGISLKNYDSTNINHNNVIAYNKVTNTGLETADGGAIEVLGRSSVDTGTIIKGNWIENAGGLATSNTDQWLPGQKGFGIYLDDMAGGVTVTDNFLKNTDWAAVQIHGGDDNVVTNNFSILGSNQEAFIRVEWAPKHGDPGLPRNNTITGNLIAATLPVGSYSTLLTANDPVIDGNFVYNVPTFGDHDLSGKPMFTNAYWGDYSLQTGSPALAAGINDLPWSSMGQDGYTASTAMPAFWKIGG